MAARLDTAGRADCAGVAGGAAPTRATGAGQGGRWHPPLNGRYGLVSRDPWDKIYVSLLVITVRRREGGMAQACEVCGKTSAMGNSVAHRGKAKYLGGVGTKITGISRRKFKPNLQKVRITTASGAHKSMRVCTQCIRSGAVTKRVHSTPFRLPPTTEGT